MVDSVCQFDLGVMADRNAGHEGHVVAEVAHVAWHWRLIRRRISPSRATFSALLRCSADACFTFNSNDKNRVKLWLAPACLLTLCALLFPPSFLCRLKRAIFIGPTCCSLRRSDAAIEILLLLLLLFSIHLPTSSVFCKVKRKEKYSVGSHSAPAAIKPGAQVTSHLELTLAAA